jgi:hypothetical protein
MRVELKYTLILCVAAIAAQLALMACSDDGSEGDNDAGTGQGDGGADSDTGTNNDTGGNVDTDTLGIPFVASCGDQVSLGATYTVCDEYYFEADETLEQTSQLNCENAQGTWSDQRCPTADLSGTCTNQGTPTIVKFYYGIPAGDIASRQNTCEALGGTWQAP